MDSNTNRGGSPVRRAGAAAIAACALLALLFLAPALLAQDSAKKTDEYYFSALESVMSFIQENYVEEVDTKLLFEGAMKGMFEALEDPYSVFLDESMASDLHDTTEGNFGGVGLYIGKQDPDPRNPEAPTYIEVASPIEDTPGWRAGLMPADLILEIDQEPTEGMTTDEAVSRIRGKPDSTVTLLVRRGQAEFSVTLKRAVIEVPTYKKAILPDGKGYLRIIEFTNATPARVRETLTEFVEASCPAIILDLRNNPGGLLSSVVQVADLFLKAGPIVTTKARNKVDNYTYKARKEMVVPWETPLIVLINQGSASASEILAGALKDQKRAWLMGETTYGKGSVQQPYYLEKVGFKLTTSRYYTPSDANIDGTGIPPDQEVKSPEMTDEQIEQLEDLLEAGTVKIWAEAHQGATKAEIKAWVAGLGLKGFEGLEWVVERMARDEINRRNIAPVYDLDYDFVLRAALDLLDSKVDLQAKIDASRSVKELQEAAKPLAAADGSGAGTTPSASALPAPSLSPTP